MAKMEEQYKSLYANVRWVKRFASNIKILSPPLALIGARLQFPLAKKKEVL